MKKNYIVDICFLQQCFLWSKKRKLKEATVLKQLINLPNHLIWLMFQNLKKKCFHIKEKNILHLASRDMDQHLALIIDCIPVVALFFFHNK